METLIKIVLAVFVGVLLGLGITIQSLDHTSRRITAGPWKGATRTAAGEGDPYALAAVARSGLLPLGTTEGLSFVADTDSGGVGLVGRCDYALTGSMPPARFWTVSLLTPEGFPVANPAGRYGFTSADVLRMMNEPLVIKISSQATSGNWLPSGDARHFVLMLRLYDTGLSTVGTTLDAAAVPQIKRLGCR